jgi:acyl-CoA thioesterase
VAAIDEDTRLTPAGEGSFDIELSERWWAFKSPWGGYVAAVLMRAFVETIGDPQRTARSFTTHFASRAQPGLARVEVTVERDGRSLATLSGRLVQDGRVIAAALGAFSPPWPNSVELSEARMPDVPEAGSLRRIPWTEQQPRFLANFDRRLTTGSFAGAGGEAPPAEVGGWLSFDDGRPLDAVRVAALMDAWWPPVYARLQRPLDAPTIDLTTHFRAPLDQVEAGEPVLALFRSTRSSDGFVEEDGELWSRAGVLLAQSRQLELLIPSREDPEEPPVPPFTS